MARLIFPNNIATIGFTLLQLLYSQPTYIRNFIVHILVIERILATVYFRWYEHWRSRWFNICWLIITVMSLQFDNLFSVLVHGSFVQCKCVEYFWFGCCHIYQLHHISGNFCVEYIRVDCIRLDLDEE